MRRFLRRAAIQREPLAVTMTGVRMGERVLQIGIADARLLATLAAKPGISGQATIVVLDERARDRARAVAADSGALVDVHVAALQRIPSDDGAFDVVIVHDAAALLDGLDAIARGDAIREWHRVLRTGGRLIAIDVGTPTGLGALLRRAPAGTPAGERTETALRTGGFAPVRFLADREGYRFTEGLKT